MALLHPTPYSTNGLLNMKGKGILIADASDIGMKPGAQFDRLYDDACDVGILLRSHKTGVVTRWSLLDTVRDTRENEILGWMLVPTFETLHKHPQLRGYQLNLTND
jgi:hypothetical protein